MKNSISNNSVQSTLLNQDIERNIQRYKAKLISIKEQYEEVKNSWRSLVNDVEGLSFANHLTESSITKGFKDTLNELKIEYNKNKLLYDRYKSLQTKSILEDLSVDLNSTDNIESTEQIKSKLITQAPIIADKIESSINSFKTAFDLLVPEAGPAESVAGEFVRAIMNILYHDRQNNELFYDGAGIYSCGNSAVFLMENGYWDDFQEIIDNQLIEDDYTIAIDFIKDKIIADIINIDFLSELNTLDYTQTDISILTANIKDNYQESLEIIPDNILNEDLVSTFLRYHDDSFNFKTNPIGFSRMYRILNKYTNNQDEDVDDIFKRATEDDQIRMLELIHPRHAY